MVELFEKDKYDLNRQSSKGNQLKFFREGMWYKADYLGYEGLSEYVISKLLQYSDLDRDEYVDYEQEQISYGGNIFNGCRSLDFCAGWNLITVERLYKQAYGHSLYKSMYEISDVTNRVQMMVSKVEQITGIADFGGYISKLLTVDALFLNEDRHTHNIAIMTNDKKQFRLAPIFDNGAGLLSDTTMEYGMGQDVIALIAKVKPKTFCDDFDEQLDIVEHLYGKRICFSFGYEQVKNIVDKCDIYDEEIRKRVIEVVMQMRRKYEYLFE